MPSTHIWPCGNTSHNLLKKDQHSHLTTNVRKAQDLHSTIRGTNPPCQKDLHLHLTTNVRKAQHLYSTMQGTNPSCQKGSALTSNNQCQKGSALIFNHARNQSFMSKGLCTYIWQPMSEGLALTFDHVGTNPTVISEWPPVPDWATW